MTSVTLDKTKKESLLEELARATDSGTERETNPAPADPALQRLRELGTELWLDTGDRSAAAPLWRREMTALTTNNTLVNQVVQTGRMDDVIREAVRRIRATEPDIEERDLIFDVGFVVNSRIARDLADTFGAMVSVELHPGIGEDIERTVRYARRYHAVYPERFIVKIPLTPEGYCAVARVREFDIPVNYTLGFSARQNYLAALVSKPSYVNVFLGRLNSVVAENKLGSGEYVGEKVTLASQAGVREVRERFPDVPTRQIAASLRAADQMVSLAGVDVFTAPPKVMEEFLKAGHRPEDLDSRLSREYEVDFAPDADTSSLETLWTIDDRFRAFAEGLASRGGTNLTGEDLRAADRDHGTRLFTDFSEEERAAIREGGKIPELGRWRTRASLDSLMTQAALQTFTVDQQALDDTIRRLAAEG